VTRLPLENGGPSWLDTRGWDDSEGVEDSASFKNVLAFLNDRNQEKLRAIVWTVMPSERATSTLKRQASFIEQFAPGQIWDRVVIACKQPPRGDLSLACQGALEAARESSGRDSSGVKLWGCDIMELSHDHHPLENIAVDKRMRVRVLTKNEARKELDEIINELEGSIQVVFRDASCSACGVTNDRRLMPDFCHFHPEQIHPGEMQPFHPEPLAPYHPQGVEKRGHRQARTGPHRKNPKHTAIGGWVGRQLTPDWAYYYPCCDRSHRTYEDAPPDCKDVHVCCLKGPGSEGCLKRYQCCGSAEGTAGCSRKFLCCGEAEGSVGCKTVCALCGREWGTPAGDCYRTPHRLIGDC